MNFTKQPDFGVRALTLPGGVQILSGAAAPTDGTTGKNKAAPGSTYYSTTNKASYRNVGTAAAPVWMPDVITEAVTITKANILAMFTTPVTVVAAPGAGYALDFQSAMLVIDFGVAAYTGGGNVTLAYGSSGATLTEIVSAANSFGSAADRIQRFSRLDPSGGILVPANTGIVITNATGVFTDPGTAVGVGRVVISYRVVPTGL